MQKGWHSPQLNHHLSVFQVEGLVELSEIDAVVPAGYAYIVCTADVVLQLEVATITFSHVLTAVLTSSMAWCSAAHL